MTEDVLEEVDGLLAELEAEVDALRLRLTPPRQKSDRIPVVLTLADEVGTDVQGPQVG